jgi:predicted Holliday junction resolvase-like endonuclease
MVKIFLEFLLFILLLLVAFTITTLRENMKTATNDITGDSIKTKCSSQNYVDNYDAIFRKPKQDEIQKENEFNTTDSIDPTVK